ncbi:MAG TPA: single-stranded-DNA-specific exonuclease RecJ [Acetobacteraceae bacterium]|nr:single-stranded-DNA-specific exonuclease RecJ [Acetobacteraceae bacterium]
MNEAGAALGVESSLSGRRWVWREAEARTGAAIAERLAVPELIGRLLAARGVHQDHAGDFLDPTLRAFLPDPSTLIDMDAAAERIADAVTRGEMVAIFGDYDVDGACSGALMAHALRRFGLDVINYVPDRMREGYGPNAPALSELARRGARLIICVDCGTAAHDHFQAFGDAADVVVLDHHKSEGPPPRLIATVNPNRLDCRSGLTTICAAAVAFLTMVAVHRILRRRGFFAASREPDLLGLLDLVALATICDVMPLTGLNRALVTQGLKVMARRDRPGIAALLEVAKITEAPSAMNCGFGLGPRINAAGRIAEAELGLRLLLAEDADTAGQLARQLDEVNRQRQAVEAGILEEAMEEAARQFAAGGAVALIARPDWHPGVVGIIAGRVKEKFNRPALVAGIGDGCVKGSGRSVPGVDLGAAVIAARQSGLLLTGGGHAMAAGFSTDAARLEAFGDFLNERLRHAAALPRTTQLSLEGSIAVPGVTPALATMVARLGPFGAGNEEPVFVLPRARVVRADRIGRNLTSIRSYVEGEGGGRLKTVLFRTKNEALAEAMLRVGGAPLHLVGHLRADQWNGAVSAGFIIADAAPA